MQTKRAVIYVRVSTGKQIEGASLDTQESACQQWTANNGILIDRIFREEGASAKTIEKRPVMNEMLAYLKANQRDVQYVVTYQTDRISRNMEDFIFLRAMLKKFGIEYKNTNSTLQSNAAEILVMNMSAAMAEFDNQQKSERVSDNMRRHTKNGYRMNKAPHGLKNVRDALGRPTVEPEPAIAEKVATVLNAYSTGTYTISTLLKLARDIGLREKRGHEMRFQALSKMLRTPIYAGLEMNSFTDGVLIESQFEGIISKQTFYRNQELLLKNKNTAAKYKVNNPDFPLKRFLRCSICHTPLRGSSPTGGSGKPSPRYHCSKCRLPSIKPDELHEQFYHLLASLAPDPEVESFIKELIVRVWREEAQLLISKEKKLHKRSEELTERKQKLIEQFIEGRVTYEEKQALMKRYEDETSVVQKQLAEVGSMSKLKNDTIDYGLGFVSNAPRIWSDTDVDHRIIYQQLVFPNGIEYDLQTNKFGTLDTSVLYRLVSIKKGSPARDESSLVTHVSQTWNSLLEGLERIDAAMEDYTPNDNRDNHDTLF